MPDLWSDPESIEEYNKTKKINRDLKTDENEKGKNKMDSSTKSGLAWGCGGLLVLVLVVAVFLMVFTVPAGRVAVITRWGAVLRVANPGLGFKVPVMDAVIKMDVRTIKNQVDASAASKDLQTVTAVIAVNYRLDGQYATWMLQAVGKDYDTIIIDPAVQNIFKDTTAKFTAEELITKRAEVAKMALDALATQMAGYHIIVENFNIVNFDFSPEYNAAIEAKQVAQQQVETAKQLLAKAQIEAQTIKAQAQGQADAQKALQDTGALSPEYLQYLALTKWNGILPVVTSGTPFIDITGFTSK